MSAKEDYDRKDPLSPQQREYTHRNGKSKKNLKDFCRGNPKTPHVVETRLSLHTGGLPGCFPEDERWRWLWLCFGCRHEKVCARCGKIIAPFLTKEECPDFAARNDSADNHSDTSLA